MTCNLFCSTLYHPEEREKLKFFPWMLGITQLVGLTMVILATVWTTVYLNGLSLTNKYLEFNIHPLCMVIGMVWLYGQAAILYRVFRYYSKLTLKLWHSALYFLSLGLITLALYTVFQFLANINYKTAWGLHGWVGIATVGLFTLQLLLGLVAFLIPAFPGWLKSSYLPLHQFMGGAILVLACVATVTGIDSLKEFGYPKRDGQFGNVLGAFVVAFVVMVLWLLSNPAWKRKPGERLPEEMRLLRQKGSSNDDDDGCDEKGELPGASKSSYTELKNVEE